MAARGMITRRFIYVHGQVSKHARYGTCEGSKASPGQLAGILAALPPRPPIRFNKAAVRLKIAWCVGQPSAMAQHPRAGADSDSNPASPSRVHSPLSPTARGPKFPPGSILARLCFSVVAGDFGDESPRPPSCGSVYFPGSVPALNLISAKL